MDEYKYNIFEAITKIREVEGDWVIISVPIPNPIFEFLRYKEYPYNEPFAHENFLKDEDTRQFLMKKLYEERLDPYFKEYGAIIKQI